MIRITDKDGKSTKWLSKKPTIEELNKLNVDQLIILAKGKKKFKNVLVNFLNGIQL